MTVYTAARRELKISSTLLRKLKAADAIRVNGERAFTNRALNTGDIVTFDLSAAEGPCDLVPEKGDVEIIRESEGLIAVNKPQGLIVHPTSSRYTGTLSNYVAGYLPEHVCHAVNRLDRDTSGVVLFAKSSYWKDLASEALGQSGEKEYVALVYGVPSPLSGTVNAPIRRLEEHCLLRVVAEDGKNAVTHYDTLETNGDYSLLRLRIETGRTHQIRVHMLHMGCPVLGDILYKTEASSLLSSRLGLFAQALHASKLSFDCPFTGERITLTAPLRQKAFLDIAAAFGISL
ncbi:MAG: RluA family pseudouridine synthase [Oscillospiraceae bacterium]|nr:RluA family pseudouridine synthase [Oscillospiraceae bacterium]